ncbi:MAG: peptidyl-prolyl cis-trans isomerase [Deltaproteobacteria bacterium]|nr:peptidyl-prolyl cis-trans isomerase [Deltaproteobacteria bacterium]
MMISISNSNLRLRDAVSIVIVLMILAVILNPADSSGFWPFTSKKKDIYIAKIGNEVITKDEFLDEMSKLNRIKWAGKTLSEQSSFAIQDIGKLLNELIDNKLMSIEAKNIGLDKETDFIISMDTYALNLFLERLRRDEILNKTTVADEEVEDYYQKQLKKMVQEKADKEKDDKQKTDAVKEGANKGTDISDKKKEPRNVSAMDKEEIRKWLFNEKSKAREREYFAEIRQKAKVKIYDELLNALPRDKAELFDKPIAEVNGESIFGREVLSNLNVSKAQDEGAMSGVLDRLILHKILDNEAMGRKYWNDDKIKAKIKKYREMQLIEQFKRKMIFPEVKVDEKDILKYYDANKEKYRESDKVSLRMINVIDKEEAKALYDDLKKEADFSYPTRDKSTDPYKEKNGDIGWVQINQLSGDIQKAVMEAKEGSILGPFPIEMGYIVLEVRDIEKGAYISLERVKSDINRIIGTEKFNAALSGYIKRLRETVPIDINQKELGRIQGRP